jgi:hypothetical protein
MTVISSITSLAMTELEKELCQNGEKNQLQCDLIVCYPKQIPAYCFFLEKGVIELNFHLAKKKYFLSAPLTSCLRELVLQRELPYSLKIKAGSEIKVLSYSRARKIILSSAS